MSCWGNDDYEQSSHDVQYDVVMGWYHACALDVNGNIDCWGLNNEANEATSTSYDVISSGYEHSCGISATLSNAGAQIIMVNLHRKWLITHPD